MERIARIARYLLCAVLAAAAVTSASAAAASHKTRQHRRTMCVVYITRHTGRHAQRVRRLVRCSKRRATIALNGHGSRSSSAKKLAPKHRAPNQPSSPQDSASAVSGALDVGLNTSVAGWTDEGSRMNQIESQTSTPWMREAFDWSQIEPSRGSYDFSRYDTLMKLAAQHNAHILANLLDTPSWAGSSWNTIPNDPSGVRRLRRDRREALRTSRQLLEHAPHAHEDADRNLRAVERAVLQQRQQRRLQPRPLRPTRQGRRRRRPRRRPERQVPARRRQPVRTRRTAPGSGGWTRSTRPCPTSTTTSTASPSTHTAATSPTSSTPPPARPTTATARSADSKRSASSSSTTAPPTSHCGSPKSAGRPAPTAAATAAPQQAARPPTSKPSSTTHGPAGRATSRPCSSTATRTTTQHRRPRERLRTRQPRRDPKAGAQGVQGQYLIARRRFG